MLVLIALIATNLTRIQKPIGHLPESVISKTSPRALLEVDSNNNFTKILAVE